ncbi:MAG: DUF3467 domain-containing protein [Methanobrevibacter sp.]|nr:DUF3467 domain-containing protein [Methanobrevibacter sp.]
MNKDKNKEKNDKKNIESLFLPHDMPQIHATAAAVAVSPLNFRLLLVNEEIEKNDEFIDGTIKTFKTAVGEIILHPIVAKKISDLLAKEVKNYESKFGELPEV